MIANNQYMCGEEASQGEALFVCVHAGCQGYALRCGRKPCSCKNTHLTHQMMDFETILEDVSKPPTLPAQLAQLEKGINDLIDGFIREMESLRGRHRDHIR